MANSERQTVDSGIESYWKQEQGLGFTTSHVIDSTKKILDGGVLKTTLGNFEPSNTDFTPDYHLSLIQAGKKYGIMKAIVPATSQDFVVVAPRNEHLVGEVEGEFDALWKSREALINAAVNPFIPKVHALGAVEADFSAFTMEFLPNHVELVGGIDGALFKGAGLVVPEYYMNTPGRKSDDFNSRQEQNYANFLTPLGSKYPHATGSDLPQIIQRELASSDYFKTTHMITSEIVRALYILNQVTGTVPRELCLGAGDFMVDPDKDNYDVKLITIRGGAKTQDPGLFTLWLQSHTETLQLFSEKVQQTVSIPYQPFTGVSIQEGIKRGREALGVTVISHNA